MPKYFIYPFSDSAGNRTSIPDDTQVTQDVSYQQGFTPPYSEVGGKNVPRLSVNQVLYDATSNLQFWQQNLLFSQILKIRVITDCSELFIETHVI